MADQPPPSPWEVAVQVKELLEERGYRAMAITSELGSMVQALNPDTGKQAARAVGKTDELTDPAAIASGIESRLT